MSSSSARESSLGVNGAAAHEKPLRPPRMSANGRDGLKSERSDSRRQDRSSPQLSNVSTSHKRTASGNARPTNRAVEERRTERTQVTTRETLVSRTRSPERRSATATGDRRRATAEESRQKAPEARHRESKTEPQPPGMVLAQAISRLSLTNHHQSAGNPRPHYCHTLPHL